MREQEQKRGTMTTQKLMTAPDAIKETGFCKHWNHTDVYRSRDLIWETYNKSTWEVSAESNSFFSYPYFVACPDPEKPIEPEKPKSLWRKVSEMPKEDRGKNCILRSQAYYTSHIIGYTSLNQETEEVDLIIKTGAGGFPCKNCLNWEYILLEDLK